MFIKSLGWLNNAIQSCGEYSRSERIGRPWFAVKVGDSRVVGLGRMPDRSASLFQSFVSLGCQFKPTNLFVSCTVGCFLLLEGRSTVQIALVMASYGLLDQPDEG